MEEKLLTIGQAALMLRISPRMLRVFANRGLIISIRWGSKGWRRFTKEDVVLFQQLVQEARERNGK